MSEARWVGIIEGLPFHITIADYNGSFFVAKNHWAKVRSIADFTESPSPVARSVKSIVDLFMLSKEALEEFKKIWKEKYGEEISDKFATKEAINLLTLFDIVYRSIKKELVNKNNLKKYETR